MFHKKTHLTSIFTEYLIWDDNQEFLFELLDKKHSLSDIPLYIKFQDYKNIFPTFRDSWCRHLIKVNLKLKKYYSPIYLKKPSLQRMYQKMQIKNIQIFYLLIYHIIPWIKKIKINIKI